MKKFSLLVIVFVVFACAKKQDETTESANPTTVDTIKKPIVGADEDLHGCKSSAGYTWSELNKECIRVFEKGTRLDPFKKDSTNAVMSAFVIFKDNNAEVFMQTEKTPLILERKSDGEPFLKDDWQLIPWKGYVLKKGNEILFTGQ